MANKHKLSLLISRKRFGCALECVASYEYLGIFVPSRGQTDLACSDHVKAISSRARKQTGCLDRIWCTAMCGIHVFRLILIFWRLFKASRTSFHSHFFHLVILKHLKEMFLPICNSLILYYSIVFISCFSFPIIYTLGTTDLY